MKKLLSVFVLSLLAASMWGLGTTTFSVPTGDNYYAAYEVVKTNPKNYNWVQTAGSPGNSGSSYTAPTGWLPASSGKPGYGYINVQSGKTVSFYVTNCTSVTILGAANNGTRTLNLSVTNNGTEVGTIATKTGNSYGELAYGTTLNATQSYVITVSASDANNAKFCQILLVGGSSTGGGEEQGGEQGGGETTTTYTITYDANGHGTAPAQVTDATALPATLPTLTESGWTFDGWYTDQACTTAATPGATISANTTLYAKWTQNQQQGGDQGGGGSTGGEDVCWNFSDTGWAAGATKDGLTLGGELEIDNSNKSIDGYNFTKRVKLGGGLSATRFISFNVTGACTITVYGMSGKSGNSRSLTIKDGNGNVLTSTFLTNDGNAIGKDTYNYTGGATTITIGSTNSGYNLYQVCVAYTGGGEGQGGGETTTTYTITYNNNGHGTAPATVNNATALPNPLPSLSETGWTFDGWYTDQACTTAATPGATISANTTLYAKWTQDQQQGGDQGGGSSTDCGELIKVVLSGEKAATQTVTGTVGGTAGVNSMGKDSPYKLNVEGAYVYIKLADGHYFQTGDVLTINGSKAMEVHTGDIANGNSTMLDHTAGPSNGVITYTLPANLPANTNTLSVYRSSSTYNGTLTYMAVNRTCTGPAPLSTDATLSDLKVDGQTVAGFVAGTTDYNVTIPATQTTAPVVSATKNDSKAGDPVITQASLPAPGQATTATVVVTAEDSTTTKTYTITFTRAELSHDADLKDIKVNGTSISGFAAGTTTYDVTVPYSSTTPATITYTTNNTAATATITGYNTVEGTATITVTAEDGTTTKAYTVNITKAAASNDANLKELKYNGTSVPMFSANTTNYSVELPFGTTTAANVTATANYSAADVQITQPTAAAGTATIVVTAEDGTTKTYTITFTVAEEDVPPVPPTTLALHTPGTYEENSLAGGYETPLTVLNGREYEVYYLGKNDNNFIGVRAGQQQSDFLLTNSTTSSSSDFTATDQWFKGHVIGSEGKDYLKAGSSPKASAVGEFDDLPGDVQMKGGSGNGYMELYVSGYDQFSIVAADGNDDASKEKYFIVKIDDIPQQMAVSKSTVTIRPFSISTGKHVIRVEASGESNCKFYGFSLRIAQEPRLKKVKGNDSTQNVLVTTAMKPITYFTKYNAMGRTELVWDGAQATGINLTTGNSSSIGDTLQLGGIAQCAAGVYNFHVVAYNAQNKETSRETGKIIVSTKIQRQTPDSLVEGFTGEEIEDIQFHYYALSADSVVLRWTVGTPAGIKWNGTNGTYTITGTPTQTGDFPFTISVKGGNSIVGMLRVQNSDLGTNPILYLYKNSYDNTFFQSMKKTNNLIARKAKSTLRETAQYAAYDLIIISEDVDANNEEAMAAAEGQIAKPVLNMKNFTYAADRLGWGDPDNGSILNTKITVMQPTHPIFAGLNATEGAQIQILDTVISKGLMPVKVEKDQSHCLATAATRGRDYNTDGAQQTFLHEIPATQRNGQKYLLFPLAAASSDKLTANGKKLLQNCIDYLKNNTVSPVVLPELQITSFTIDNIAAAINQNDNIIELTMPQGTDLKAVMPVVTLKDSKTHVAPRHWNKDGVTVDLTNDYMGLDYIVTDYINVRVYTVYAHVENPEEGLENIYADGEWINIYDIQGRKIMTTNESLHQLSLSRGMYIVVTARGSFKILR